MSENYNTLYKFVLFLSVIAEHQDFPYVHLFVSAGRNAYMPPSSSSLEGALSF